MGVNLTFSGAANSTYTPPGTLVQYGGLAYSASGTGIRAVAFDFSQLVDVIAAETSGYVESTIDFAGAAGGFEVGFCFINTARSGFSLIITAGGLLLRKEVAASGGSTIASLSTTNSGSAAFRVSLNLTTGAISVTKNAVEVLTGTYTDITTGLRPGLQSYISANPGPSYTTLITDTGTGVARVIDSIGAAGVVTLGATGVAIQTTGFSTLTSLTIGGIAVTALSTIAGDGTFTAPALADLLPFGLIGASVPIAVSDGVNTAVGTCTIALPAGWTYASLSGLLNTSPTSLLYNAAPAVDVNDQIISETAKITVYQSLDAETGFFGTQTLYHIDATDGVWRSFTLITGSGGGADTTPDTFGFNTPSLAALGATVTSTNTTISGINAAAAVSVTGGLVSINGGAFVSSGTITNGQTIAARVTASNSFSTAVTATVNIGGVTAQFTATTIAADTTPDSFSFNAVTNVAASSAQTSNTVTVAGLNTSAAVSVSGGTYSKNGGAYTSTAGTVVNGDTLTVRHTASASALTQVTTTLTVGTFSAAFSSTTEAAVAPDTTPDAITFPASTNSVAGSAQASAVRSITGINASTPVTAATNCTYSIAGGAATAANGSAANNQSIQLFAFASNTPGATVNTSITIGGQVFTWAITTAQPQISLPAQGGSMSGDARLNVLQKLTSNILSALNAVGSSTVPVPVTANIKRGNYAYSSILSPSVSTKTANQLVYTNPFAPSGEAIAIQLQKFTTGNILIGSNAFVFLECDLAGSTAYKPVYGTKRLLSDAIFNSVADGNVVFLFDGIKGGNWRMGVNFGTVQTPGDVPATGVTGFNATVMN